MSKNTKKSKRRRARKRAIRLTVLFSVIMILAAALLIFRRTNALISWKVYPLSSTERIDLSGQRLVSAREVARLTALREAVLSDNSITDVSPLVALRRCAFIDLTGNPVSDESYAALRSALPDAVILCDAEDSVTTTLALGGHPLPGLDAIMRVLSSHTALITVDLRDARLSGDDCDALRAAFPQIAFVVDGDDGQGSVLLRIDRAVDIAPTLLRLDNVAHVTITGAALSPSQYRATTAQFPDMSIDCMISLYGKTCLISSTTIDLTGCATDNELEDNLRLFPQLKTLTLGETTPDEADRLRASLALENLEYTFNGSLISPQAVSLDLRGANADAQLVSKLIDEMPLLERVSLDAPDEAMRALMNDRSDLFFIYDTTLLGMPISTGDTVIDFDAGGVTVKDSDVQALSQIIPALRNLREMRLFESRLSVQSMDALFDGFPDVFFGFTFNVVGRRYTVRSDVTAFSTLLGDPRHTYKPSDFKQLRYCKNLLALDLGHNAIVDASFLSDFPKLRLLILADNNVRDLTPIGELQDLEYLELFMNYQVQSFEPLKKLTKLTDLNVRLTRYSDSKTKHNIEPFMEMTWLKRLWLTSNNVSSSDLKRLREALPDCTISCTNKHSTDDNWRDDAHYPVIQRIFSNRVWEPFATEDEPES